MSKPPIAQKSVSVVVTSLGCLSFTTQNDVCLEFDTVRLFSDSSAGTGKPLSAPKIVRLKCVAISRIYDTIHSLKDNFGPIVSKHDKETLTYALHT